MVIIYNHHYDNYTMWGPQDSVQLPYKWLNSMVYGRYNELVHGFINQLTTGGGGTSYNRQSYSEWVGYSWYWMEIWLLRRIQLVLNGDIMEIIMVYIYIICCYSDMRTNTIKKYIYIHNELFVCVCVWKWGLHSKRPKKCELIINLVDKIFGSLFSLTNPGLTPKIPHSSMIMAQISRTLR